MKEKIIIRLDKSYDKTEVEYLVCFPQEEANVGRINYVPLKQSLDATAGCYDEMDMEYFYSKKILHKSDPLAAKVARAFEKLYGTKVEVVEKLGRPTFTKGWYGWSWLN